MKIRKGDKIKIIAGKDKGTEAVVEKVYTKNSKLLVENVNLVTKHVKPSKENKGGIIKVNRPIDSSNVQVICQSCKKVTRIGYKLIDSKKFRICKKCGEIIK